MLCHAFPRRRHPGCAGIPLPRPAGKPASRLRAIAPALLVLIPAAVFAGPGGGTQAPARPVAHDPAAGLPGVADSSVAGVEPAPWVRNGVIYEISPRDFGPTGTLADVTAGIGRLQSMGVTILSLTQVQPLGSVPGKGTGGSTYPIRDSMRVNPALGGDRALRALVSAAHARGMKVILDWVADRTARDNPLVDEHPDWYHRDASGRPAPPDRDGSDDRRLDYGNPGLRTYMAGAMTGWVREFGLDGFRCDAAGTVPMDFWNATRAALEAVKPDVMMLAGAEGGAFHAAAFDLTYDGGLDSLLQAVHEGRAGPSVLVRHVTSERGSYPRNALRLRFLENHDQERGAAKSGPGFHRAGLGFVFLSEGVPLLHAGEEAGITRRPSPFGREPGPRPTGDRALADSVRSFIRTRTANPVLRTGATHAVANDRPDAVVTFLRGDFSRGESILAAVNFTGKPVEFHAMDPRVLGRSGEELFRGGRVAVSGGRPLSLGPWGAMAVKFAAAPEAPFGSAPAGGPAGAGQADSALVARADSVQTEVASLRGWAFRSPVRKAVYTEAELRRYVERELFEVEYPPDTLARVQASLRMVGLLPPDLDMKRELTDVLTNQIGGFYDPATEAFYMVQRPGADYGPAIERMMIAHELTHALDDQYVGLDSLTHRGERTEDREFALGSVVEGSATELMTRYLFLEQAQGKLDAAELAAVMESETSRSEPFLSAPPYFSTLLARYTCGMLFLVPGGMAGLTAKDVGPAVGRRLLGVSRNPPESSEQILHPDKYWNGVDRDPPVEVEDHEADLAIEAAGFGVYHRDTFGEILAAVLTDSTAGFRPGALPTADSWTNPAAEGWGGDRFFLLGPRKAAGDTLPEAGALRGVWITAWDTPGDREEFRAAYDVVRPDTTRYAFPLGDRALVYTFGLDPDAAHALFGRIGGEAAADPGFFTWEAGPWPTWLAGDR